MKDMVTFEVCPAEPARFHEYANLFPMMQGEALDSLREDILQNGVREPVVFLGGAILDGRNRYMCARDLGLEYPRVEFTGDNPLGYVISHNLHRRHLTESQRASVAAKLANMGQGRPSVTAQIQAVSQADAARMLNVGRSSVQAARHVHEAAPEEINRALDDGRISVSLAAKVADLPEAAQAEIIAAPPEQVKEIAREVVKRAHVANNSGNNEWYTPREFIEAARTVLGGFDLDPASSEIANATVKADRIFTAEDDGLSQEWPVGTIWCNPPYAKGLIEPFSARIAAEIRRGSSGIVLVNNATETAWFQMIAAECSAICFPKTRIRFISPDGIQGAPLQGQAILYCGANREAFAEAFSGFGLVVSHG